MQSAAPVINEIELLGIMVSQVLMATCVDEFGQPTLKELDKASLKWIAMGHADHLRAFTLNYVKFN